MTIFNFNTPGLRGESLLYASHNGQPAFAFNSILSSSHKSIFFTVGLLIKLQIESGSTDPIKHQLQAKKVG